MRAVLLSVPGVLVAAFAFRAWRLRAVIRRRVEHDQSLIRARQAALRKAIEKRARKGAARRAP